MTFRSAIAALLNQCLQRAAERVLTGPLSTARPVAPPVKDPAGSRVFRLSAGSTASVRVQWRVPFPFLVEGHGHCLVLTTREGARLAELHVEGEGPATLQYRTGEPSRWGNRVNLVELRSAAAVEVTVTAGKGQVADRGVARPGSGWRSRQGERDLTYYLEEPLSNRGSKRLCVVFSAIAAPYDFTYNYRSSLADVDSYRLYILDDFGSQGSYYYADHRDAGIFAAVQDLIRDVSARVGTRPADTVFVGSSKGGTAALAHGLQHGAGRIIAGAPQTLPGTYLEGASSGILAFIAGDDSDESVAWLDQLIPLSVERRRGEPQVTILVGENDSHLHVHVQPFVALAGEAGLHVQTVVVGDLDHQNIGSAFGPYLTSALAPEQDSFPELLPYQLARRDGPEEEVQLKLWLPPGEVAAVRISTRNRDVLVSDYSTNTFYKIAVPATQPVRATVSRRGAAGEVMGSFNTRWLPAGE